MSRTRNPKQSSSEPAPVQCPSCGSYDFKVNGYVAYVQRYNSRTDDYSGSGINWEADFPHYVQCAGCEQDVTQLFKKAGVLTQFYRHVRFKGGRPER
jgi:ribosomal protein S27E